MSLVEIRVPDLGDLKGADVIEVSAAIGAEVAAESTLLQLESEKAVMELTSPQAGRVTEILVKAGDRVTSGQLVARLAASEGSTAVPARAGPHEAAAALPAGTVDVHRPTPADSVAHSPGTAGAGDSRAAASAARESGSPAAPPALLASAAPVPTAAAADQRVYAGPAARRLARQLGVDLGAVRGSGPRGRIVPADIKTHVRLRPAGTAAAAPSPPAATEADFEKFGPVEYEKLSRIQKISARRLTTSWTTVPHVTQHNEADITDLEALRLARKDMLEAKGVRLTLLAFLLRAVAITLAEMPRFNASLCPDGERLALKRYCHLGFAADTPHGLVVPVVRDVDRKDALEVARELAALSAAARAGKLTPTQMQGSTFTVSSLGGVGGTHFTPIVNPPEVAILGAGRAKKVPAYVGARVEPRLVLPISLSYDHRVIDGVAGVRFTERLRALLEDPMTLLAAVP